MIWSKRLLVLAVFLTLFASFAFSSTITLDANGAKDVNNLSKIALAIHNYESANNVFPPEYTSSAGNPLLSWRVAILPYLGYASLYNMFDQTKAWNDPANLALLNQMPDVFRSPLDTAGSTTTRYVGGSGTGTMFEGSTGIHFSSITDGPSNTILVGETESTSISWTAPTDIAVGSCPMLDGSTFSSIVSGAVPFVFADGSVAFLPNGIDCNTLQDFFLRNDGTTLPDVKIGYTVSSTVPEPASIVLLSFGLVSLMKRRTHRGK